MERASKNVAKRGAKEREEDRETEVGLRIVEGKRLNTVEACGGWRA